MPQLSVRVYYMNLQLHYIVGSGNATCVRLHPLSGRPEKNVEIQIKE